MPPYRPAPPVTVTAPTAEHPAVIRVLLVEGFESIYVKGTQRGALLRVLAVGGQILVVTHLPQVASHADHHFRVAKRVAGGRTHTDVVSLDSNTRVEEVARMLGGKEITDLTRSHAEEMITTAAGNGR